MTDDPRKMQIIARWLADLADLTKGGKEPPTPHKIKLYAGMLAEMFPVEAFTFESLRVACFEQEYFPAFDTVRARLRQWWHEHMPAKAPLIGYDGAPALNDWDRHWVDFFYLRRSQIADDGDPLADDPDPGRRACSKIAILESLIRQQSLKAWAFISGLRQETFRLPPSAQEQAAVSAAVAAILES